jgi:hypothetical protein
MTVSTAGLLMSIQEKKYVGPYATTGVYAWARGDLFVTYADAVLRDGASEGGRYYVAQVYSQAVAEGLRFRNIPCDAITKLGDVAGRDVVIADHLIDTAKTLCDRTALLKAHGRAIAPLVTA